MSLSGFKNDMWHYNPLLLKSKCHKTLPSEYIESFGYIPTMLDTCPNCNNEVKWRTTGIIPPSLKCDKCGLEFTI